MKMNAFRQTFRLVVILAFLNGKPSSIAGDKAVRSSDSVAVTSAAIAATWKGQTDKDVVPDLKSTVERKPLAIRRDPYILWLPARLMYGATQGTLFRARGDDVELLFDESFGDDAYWYIVEIKRILQSGEAADVIKPCVIWEKYGSFVTPDLPPLGDVAPRDGLWDTVLDLPGVESGDTVALTIYALSRERVKVVDDLDFSFLSNTGEATLVTHLILPVLLHPPKLGG